MERYFNTKKPKIKAIVFDFDETLYFSPNTRKLYIRYIKNTVMSLGGHDESRATQLMEELGFTESNKASPSFRASCGHFGITKQQWDRYRIDNFFEIDYENAQTVSLSTLKRLKKTYPLFIASNEVKENVQKKAAKMNIDLSVFDEIYAPQKEEINNYIDKKNIYLTIAKKLGIETENLLVVGDRYKVDAEPMLQIGGNAVIIKRPDEIDTLETILSLN
jgi:FMN phosphatase YigB (HAD superfamily)